MKIKFLFLFVFSFFVFTTWSQDVIIKKDLDEINAKVIKVGINEIEYKKFENPKGPNYSINKNDVMMIKYANGTKDVFANEKIDQKKVEATKQEIKKEKTENPQSPINNDDKCAMGTMDARNLHHKIGQHILLGIFTGPLGVIGTAVSSPKPWNNREGMMMIKDANIIRDRDYLHYYEKKARQRNIINTSIGFAILIVATVIIASSH